MADHLKNSALPRALSDVMGDLVELVQKEFRLARAEVTDKLSMKIRAGLWVSVAGVLAFVAILAGVQALILGLASGFHIALHWSCLIVAGLMAALAAVVYAVGRQHAKEDLAPERTIYQVKQDITTVKEQLQ